ncbi:MAG: MBL fold metallo-hydrolase [Bradymonadia bacterium]
MLTWMPGTLTMLAVIGISSGCTFSAPRFSGPAQKPAHEGAPFDGEKFHNRPEVPHGSFTTMMKWVKTREPGHWGDFTDHPPGPKPLTRVEGDGLRVTFVNHSTFLIQTAGVNLLTDPIWAERCSPVSFAGPKRVRPPGIKFEDLPPIDAVLISHNHYDHLDADTLRRLAERDQPQVFAGLGNAALLQTLGLEHAIDLDWWQSRSLGSNVKITFVPAQHFSGRGLSDRDATLWGGFVIEGPWGPIYFAGDTGFGPHFQAIRDHFGPMQLALLPIGAFKPTWVMSTVHISPMEAVKAHMVLDAAQSVGMHFGTFPLADDGEHEPKEALDRALTAAGLPHDSFRTLGFGEGWSPNRRALTAR